MSSSKRKAAQTIGRRVRARLETSEELDFTDSELDSTDVKPLDHQSDPEEDEDETSSSDEGHPNDDAASISFGALAQAHATLSRSEKSKKHTTKPGTDDLWENNEAIERKAGRQDRRDFNRSSKHAPTEISSKKAVSRKREVVVVKKRDHRDPRFESLAGPVDESRFRTAYSFLDGYREDEIKELKDAIKITKDEDSREKLKRALLSMQSKKKAQLRKDKEQEVLERHKQEEKELVKMGKQPFYLKKTEQKKRVLLDQYGELKGKQLDHVIERRRKKVEGKEKKKMPLARRAVE